MRVTSTGVQRTLQQRTYPVDRASQTQPSAGPSLAAGPAYRVSLSGMAREVALARRSMAEAPVERATRVSAIREALAQGAYAPSSLDIADKILQAIGFPSPSPSPTGGGGRG
jgi:flagellar biosynthesis anti-sigma factor FlgM